MGHAPDVGVAQAHGPARCNTAAQSPETAAVNHNQPVFTFSQNLFECVGFWGLQSKPVAEINFEVLCPGQVTGFEFIIRPDIHQKKVVAG